MEGEGGVSPQRRERTRLLGQPPGRSKREMAPCAVVSAFRARNQLIDHAGWKVGWEGGVMPGVAQPVARGGAGLAGVGGGSAEWLRANGSGRFVLQPGYISNRAHMDNLFWPPFSCSLWDLLLGWKNGSLHQVIQHPLPARSTPARWCRGRAPTEGTPRWTTCVGIRGQHPHRRKGWTACLGIGGRQASESAHCGRDSRCVTVTGRVADCRHCRGQNHTIIWHSPLLPLTYRPKVVLLSLTVEW